MKTSNALGSDILWNLKHRVKDEPPDLHKETESLLNSTEAFLHERGGKLSFCGKDPIIPTVLRYGCFSA